MESGPVGRAFQKAGFGLFWCPEECYEETRFLDDASSEDIHFWRLIVRIFILTKHPECPNTLLISLNALRTTSFQQYMVPVAHSIAAHISKIVPECRMGFYNLYPLNDLGLVSYSPPLKLSYLLNPDNYRPVSPNLRNLAELEYRITESLSSNHSPLQANFHLYKNCILGSNAIKLLGLTFLMNPSDIRTKILYLFYKAIVGTEISEEETEWFFEWRKQMKDNLKIQNGRGRC